MLRMHSADSVGERGHAKMAGFFPSLPLHMLHQASYQGVAVPLPQPHHTARSSALSDTPSRQERASSAAGRLHERHLLATGGSHSTTYISPQLCLVKGSLKLFLTAAEIISYVSGNNVFYSSIYHRIERKGLTHKLFLQRLGKVSGISPLCCFFRTKLFCLVLNSSQGEFMLGNERKSSWGKSSKKKQVGEKPMQLGLKTLVTSWSFSAGRWDLTEPQRNWPLFRSVTSCHLLQRSYMHCTKQKHWPGSQQVRITESQHCRG